MPADLSRAIVHANRILDWQDNLGPDEMPPEWMWLFEDSLSNWFDKVAEARKKPSTDADNEPSAPMMDNELANRFRG